MGPARAVTGRRRSGGWLRGLSGVLAGGMAAVAVALVVVWIVAARMDMRGPGTSTLLWHGLTGVGAVLAQVYADRHSGLRGTLAAIAIIVVTLAVLAVQWLV